MDDSEDNDDYQPDLRLEEQDSEDNSRNPVDLSTSSQHPPTNNSSRPDCSTNTNSNTSPQPTGTASTRNPNHTQLTLHNYSTVGKELGRPALERMLNDPKRKTQNRPPSAILGEAQALQGYYTMDKMSLSLVGNTSLATLESALFEGLISRDRNGYTTWMSYSLANTVQISMPAGGQSDGFAEHNQNCRKWTELTETESETFQPKLFEKLAYAHFTNIATPVSEEERATDQEITQYMHHFTRLANLDKVSKYLQSGVLGQTIAKSLAVIEKRGRKEIGKVATQLQSIFKRFGIHSHLLVASWNPKTKLENPMWNPEYTTSPRWAEYTKRTHHLARDFAIGSTAAQIKFTETQKSTNQNNKTPQVTMRTKLTNLLNNEIRKNLPHTPQGPKHDVYPKTPNPHKTIAGRCYQGVQLAVRQATDLQVTQEMLTLGAKGGRLTDKQVKTWSEDIEEGSFPYHGYHKTCPTKSIAIIGLGLVFTMLIIIYDYC
ncbi:uncharacterized protein MELLADRAFT_64767 [Melampsora larici-populina 98AG31]|uniref:Uncharacterized protein n=1 Tax=Melampsora larici-populina (strain 98AG31 / pathotype 3-4-7) TaxID=747676 RepID=F4RSQ0_MELLP|nr:uncharacterized protein MELLADRAFT_64767 [Melampsora larici-populina 98AG31]EGG04641.1 hypothetical protein MELLADRAFT_64767 [Melampsora larici-populina 98AG31]